MSTSNTHQQTLADVGYETRPPMLERGSYIPLASRFRRYLDRKRENKKWLNKAIDEGPYEFKNYTPLDSQTPRMQTENVLTRDDLKHYEAEIEKLVNTSRAKKLEKSHDPLALVAHTGSSSRIPSPYYVTHPSSVVDYDDDYQGDAFQNNYEDPLTSAMMLLARAITQRFSNPTNNRLRNSFNTKNQAIMQADRVNIQSRNYGNDGKNTRRSYVQEEVIEGTNVHNDAGNIQRTIRTTSSGTTTNVQCYNCSEKGHYAHNCPKPRVRDSKMEEIKELSANICLMARIQPTNFDSSAGASYDSAFVSKVQTPSTSYVNLLFSNDNQEQKYSKKPQTINNTIGDDQIDSNIIFNEPNVDVNSGSVEYDNNVQASYEIEQLAIKAYKEAEKQQIHANKADSQARRLEKDLQTHFIRDRDIIRDLERKRDNLQLSVVELKSQIVELQKTQTILKRKMSENEDKYHDTVLDLEAKAKENENVVLKIGRSLQGMFLLGPKPMSFYDPNVKHGLGTSTSPSETKPSVASMPSSNLMKLYLEKMENKFTTLFALLQTNSKHDSIFYTTPEEIRLTKFCQQVVKSILHELHLNFEIFQKRFSEDIKEMKYVFDSTESDLSATWKQNELLNDQLLEAKLKHEIECCMLLSHECVNNNDKDEIEKIQRDSIKSKRECKNE
ncbi:retrovirus-related pol polyprotein from transposon TNT 1-94 [Tanacetum coccineum]|uniref:Retrovirus-related pol polyprotein from transposon TNT 1-94 n=1 Tax=Tanacetum coccineum TaxID=301880 RepID=A0ABQ5GAF3_9ASTR